MIKDTNYVSVHGWMSTKLGLKGNALMIYAIIYGFSQEENSVYKGSLQYLQEWTNSTRQGVINTLKKLIDSKLIFKKEGFPFNEYTINTSKLSELSCKQNLHENNDLSKKSLHNNIDNINNKDINNYEKNKDMYEQIENVIRYLNSTCNTKFKSSSNNSKKFIKARLKEGYKFEDFKDVIDFKWKEWGQSPVKFSTGQMSDTYLRPSTLFGNKFEEYLQAAWTDQLRSGSIPKSLSVDKLEERSDLAF